MGSLMRFIKIVADKKRNFRKDVFRDKFENIIVDTCCPNCIKKWETGISKNNEKKWTIVQEYDNRKKAEIGHKKWVMILKKNKNIKLKPCRQPIDLLFG